MTLMTLDTHDTALCKKMCFFHVRNVYLKPQKGNSIFYRILLVISIFFCNFVPEKKSIIAIHKL